MTRGRAAASVLTLLLLVIACAAGCSGGALPASSSGSASGASAGSSVGSSVGSPAAGSPRGPSSTGSDASDDAAQDETVTVTATADRVLKDPDLTESSDLAASPQHDGLLWTTNDSGNAPVIYGVGRDGRTAVRLRVRGSSDVDWEGLAAWRGADGVAYLAIGDIGDNGAVRSTLEVAIVKEPTELPASGATLTVTPVRRITLTYPDRARDAETLMVDPRDERILIAGKGLQTRLFEVPATAWPGRRTGQDRAGLKAAGVLPMLFATDGVALPGGQLLIRTYTTLALVSPLAAGAEPRRLATVALPSQRQGEGVAAADGQVYLSTEGTGMAVLRFAMPQVFSSQM